MKTSNPFASPVKKKHSLIQNFISIEDSPDDLETEIQHRRLEVINKSAELRRRSTTVPLLPGFSATQLSQHYKDCIKLSTENKINTKNAFNFFLIDVMAAMAKKNDSEISKNFQVASCTLDASVKIYGYRVDAVHTEVIKMAGGFRGPDMPSDGEDEARAGEEEDNADVKLKPKKKKKKPTVVPAESLNIKSETEILMDVVPRPNFLQLKKDGNDLLIRIPKNSDAGLLLLDSDEPCWPYGDGKTLENLYQVDETFDADGLMTAFKEIELSPDDKLCPAYSNFEFGKDYEDESEDDFNISQNSNRFEFDMDASVHDVSFSDDNVAAQSELQRNRLDIPVGGYDSGEEIVLPAQPCQNRNEKIAISDMKKRISVAPLEYSMFDEKVFKCWAGPTYWKVRPTFSKKMGEEDKENEDASKQVPLKRTRKGKSKVPVGMFEVSEEVVARLLASGDKYTLYKSTMLNWHPRNTTMPKDCKYKSRNLATLFHLPNYEIHPKVDVDDIEHEETLDSDDDRPAGEELEYCSSLIIHDDDPCVQPEDDNCSQADDDNCSQPDTEMSASKQDVEAWDEQNMVAAPHKVEKIPVSTFKRKKHIDIKHLKKCIWNILVDRENTGNAEEEKVTKPIEFSQLIKTYPGRVPGALAASLSAPLVFNALLHLTNEKCLVLSQEKTNKLDFVVSQ